MDRKHFGILSDLVESRIRKCDTAMRESIKPDERLAVTLRYLATGESFKSLEFQFRISRTAISNIVVETCQAIFNVLSRDFLKLPSTPEEWLYLGSIFEKRWNFPNGIGAVALTKYMMKPYPQSGLDTEKRIFNYRLSRNRRISEDAFGIMANRWRILRSAIPLSPDKVTQLTLGIITLHNFLIHSPDSVET